MATISTASTVPCVKPSRYAGTLFIALIVTISVAAVASVVYRPDERDISSGAHIIVASVSVLIHHALAC